MGRAIHLLVWRSSNRLAIILYQGRSCAPEVMVPDARVFSSMQNEQKYSWLYDSVVHQGYLCKFCEMFCGHSSSSQEFVTVGINLITKCFKSDMLITSQ
jgi:hypothetical protein